MKRNVAQGATGFARHVDENEKESNEERGGEAPHPLVVAGGLGGLSNFATRVTRLGNFWFFSPTHLPENFPLLDLLPSIGPYPLTAEDPRISSELSSTTTPTTTPSAWQRPRAQRSLQGGPAGLCVRSAVADQQCATSRCAWSCWSSPTPPPLTKSTSPHHLLGRWSATGLHSASSPLSQSWPQGPRRALHSAPSGVSCHRFGDPESTPREGVRAKKLTRFLWPLLGYRVLRGAGSIWLLQSWS